MHSIDPTQKPYLVIYTESQFPKKHVLPLQPFPLLMPCYMTVGLSQNGILAIDKRFHQIVMDRFFSVLRENPISSTDDDLPTNFWINILLKKLRDEFIFTMVV